MLKRFQDGGIDGLPFESVARDFRMIESMQQPVIIPFDQEAQDMLDALENADHIGSIARRLQPYIVQMPHEGFAALHGSGAIQPLAPERFAEQFMILMNLDLYNKYSGLYWDNPAFIKAEHLNW